jgi:hypothetical protein
MAKIIKTSAVFIGKPTKQISIPTGANCTLEFMPPKSQWQYVGVRIIYNTVTYRCEYGSIHAFISNWDNLKHSK